MKKKFTSTLTGISGEYFVAAVLSQLGFIASITLRNTQGIDILASNHRATKTIAIQVKTTRKLKSDWILNKKAEKINGSNQFYVFVKLKGTKERPDFFIVPSKKVAHFVSTSHKRWLLERGKHGRRHKDTAMRKFGENSSKYLERWDLLGL